MGLVINTDYDARLDNSRARGLFRRSLFSLANLDPAGALALGFPPPPPGSL